MNWFSENQHEQYCAHYGKCWTPDRVAWVRAVINGLCFGGVVSSQLVRIPRATIERVSSLK